MLHAKHHATASKGSLLTLFAPLLTSLALALVLLAKLTLVPMVQVLVRATGGRSKGSGLWQPALEATTQKMKLQ
jgi:hypothetical protein